MTIPHPHPANALQAVTKPKQPDRRRRRSKTKAERLTHSPGRSDRETTQTCRTYFLEQGTPLTSTLPLAESWGGILAEIRPDRQDACGLVIGILIKEKIAPCDLTMPRLETLIETTELRHRQAYLAGTVASNNDYKVQRSIRSVYAQAVAGLLLFKEDNPQSPHFQDLCILDSSFEKKKKSYDKISESTIQIVDSVMMSEKGMLLQPRARKNYRNCILEYCIILENNGILITQISDIWQTGSLEAIFQAWQIDTKPPVQCLKSLHVLRWTIINTELDLDVIDSIRNYTKIYIGRQGGVAAPRDLAIIARYGETKTFVEFLESLLTVAGGHGVEGQPRQTIAMASGACLCLIQLMSGVRLPELEGLAIDYDRIDQKPRIVPVIGASQKKKTRNLPTALKTKEAQDALGAFCDFFSRCYGRLPTSLLDGLEGEREFKEAARSRMRLTLEALAPGLTPDTLRDLLVWRLSKRLSQVEIYRVLAYTSFKQFQKKYRPLFALASSHNLVD